MEQNLLRNYGNPSLRPCSIMLVYSIHHTPLTYVQKRPSRPSLSVSKNYFWAQTRKVDSVSTEERLAVLF